MSTITAPAITLDDVLRALMETRNTIRENEEVARLRSERNAEEAKKRAEQNEREFKKSQMDFDRRMKELVVAPSKLMLLCNALEVSLNLLIFKKFAHLTKLPSVHQ
ncbi:MAG: hypothetical protein RIR79_2084 [Pseudomonadota bacterium]